MTVKIKAKGVYDPRTQAAGWGVVIEAGAIWNGIAGRITDPVNGSTEVQFAAMGIALQEAMRRDLLHKGGAVEMLTDCRECIAILLLKVPGAKCVGDIDIIPAKKLGARIRDCAPLRTLVAMVMANDLTLTLRVGPTDPKIIEAARAAVRKAVA